MSSVIFDVDGTICFDGRSIAPDITDALTRLAARATVVFASARPIRDLLPVLPEHFHAAPLIGGNGAFTRHGETLDVLGLEPTERRRLDELIDAHDLSYLIDGPWNYAYTGDPAHRIFRQLDAGGLASNIDRAEIEQYAKVVLFTEDPELLGLVAALPLHANVHPDQGIVDLAPAGITKHHAVVRLGIADDGYIAFGNDRNDVELLRNARVSYRVGDHEALGFADHHIAREDVAAAIDDLAVRPCRSESSGGRRG